MSDSRDFGWPPERTVTLGPALEQAADRVDEAEAEVSRLDDGDGQALRGARDDLQTARDRRNAIRWLVEGDGRDDGFAGFGPDATVTVQAHTRRQRDRVMHELEHNTMGRVTALETEVYLAAAAVSDAPWLDGDEDLGAHARILHDQLPPAITDWLTDIVNDLNDLSEGN